MKKQNLSEVLKQAGSSGITTQRTFASADTPKPQGRKPKNEDEKSNQRVCIYLTKDEYNALEAISKEKFLGMSAQALSKQVILKFIQNGGLH